MTMGGGDIGDQGMLIIRLFIDPEAQCFTQAGTAAVSHYQALRGQFPISRVGAQGNANTLR